MNPIRNTAIVGLLSFAFFAACKKQEVTYYEVPKEQQPVQAPFLQQQMTDPSTGQQTTPPQMDMAAQTLPQSALSDAGMPGWRIPTNWIEGRAVQMRRASFTVKGSEAIDISVNSFPGDVGGLAANVNRWRTQIGLLPLSSDEAEAIAQPLKGIHDGYYIDLPGTAQRTLAAIFVHEGTSWFFKMTGPSAMVTQQETPFRTWVESIAF